MLHMEQRQSWRALRDRTIGIDGIDAGHWKVKIRTSPYLTLSMVRVGWLFSDIGDFPFFVRPVSGYIVRDSATQKRPPD
jgi:hypothetical protein